MLGKFKFCTFCGLDELFSFYVLCIFRDTEIFDQTRSMSTIILVVHTCYDILL